MQLNGAINPEGPTTTWYFQYGLSAYYGVQTSSQTLSGLGARPVNTQLTASRPAPPITSGSSPTARTGSTWAPTRHSPPNWALERDPAASCSAHRPAASSSRLTIAVSGHLSLPGSVTRSAGCNGTVAVEIRRGNSTIALQRASLRSNCSYSLHVYVATSRLHGTKRLGIFAVYDGNALLLPTSTHRTLRI